MADQKEKPSRTRKIMTDLISNGALKLLDDIFNELLDPSQLQKLIEDTLAEIAAHKTSASEAKTTVDAKATVTNAADFDATKLGYCATLSQTKIPDAKAAVIYAREKGLDFNAKDVASVENKGKEGTRFNDTKYPDAISQRIIDQISVACSGRPEYMDLILVMYVNRFCCKENGDSYIWKEVNVTGNVSYVKKTAEEVKDILSLYSAPNCDLYTLYMMSSHKLLC